MDKKICDFYNEDSDILPLPPGSYVIREKSSNGTNFMTLKMVDGEKDYILFSWWDNPNKPAKKDKDPPKHTGGKQPYVMLMTKEVEKLGREGVRNVAELVGHLSLLGDYIEWNTGKLINRRTKRPLKYKEVQTIFTCGNKKLNRLLGDMKKHELLYSASGGYVISSRLIKKGKMNEVGDN